LFSDLNARAAALHAAPPHASLSPPK
jgi:hypothetical protein